MDSQQKQAIRDMVKEANQIGRGKFNWACEIFEEQANYFKVRFWDIKMSESRQLAESRIIALSWYSWRTHLVSIQYAEDFDDDDRDPTIVTGAGWTLVCLTYARP